MISAGGLCGQLQDCCVAGNDQGAIKGVIDEMSEDRAASPSIAFGLWFTSSTRIFRHALLSRCYHSSVRDTVFSSLNGSVHRNTLQTTEGGDVPSVLGQIL